MHSYQPPDSWRPNQRGLAARREGRMVKWNAEKGFGFVRPVDGSRDVFLHLRSLPFGQVPPKLGETITYEVENDAKQRPRAVSISYPQRSASAPSARSGPASDPPIRRAPRTKEHPFALIFPLAFLAAVGTASWMGYLPAWVGLTYGAVSLYTLIVYGADKADARDARWRTRESTLHFLELAGGWPGALVAQRVFRHKNRKGEFQVVFWSIVALHLAVWGWVVKSWPVAWPF